MNESHISSQRLNLDPCPIHSSEGFLSNFKENNKFLNLWEQKIYPVGKELGLWACYDGADKYRIEDYKSFYTDRKKDPSITAEKRIQWLLDNKYSKEAISKFKKEKESKEREEKSKLPEDVEKALHSRIESLANKALLISKTLITAVKTNKEIKETLDKFKLENKEYSGLNYLKYIDKIPTKEEIIYDIKTSIKYDLKNGKSTNNIKLDYTIYIIDMASMREVYDDIYDDFSDDKGNDLYDIFYNNMPKINANPFDIEFGGLGWESICATLSEK